GRKEKIPHDDYFRIEYLILSSLYESIRKGEQPDIGALNYKSLGIPAAYWQFILESLSNSSYVSGVSVLSTKQGRMIDISEIRITRDGIAYLQDNTKMKKEAAFLKEAKEIIPGL
ncbi:MAG: hypothetical protein HUJ54_13505, partial [Erysipelotrichaceae bacterium]|nr:hypothetical protein [Erysipelotrichaceae bacterium]